jgi:AbrB family looped-hinge helix DNA binding protein
MPVYETTMTSKGQMTLPSEIRKLWGLEPGDRVEFFADREGRFFVRPLNRAPTDFYKDLPQRSRVRGIANDEQAITKAVRQRDQRSKRKRNAAA